MPRPKKNSLEPLKANKPTKQGWSKEHMAEVAKLRGNKPHSRRVPADRVPNASFEELWEGLNWVEKHYILIAPVCDTLSDAAVRVGRKPLWYESRKYSNPDFKRALELRWSTPTNTVMAMYQHDMRVLTLGKLAESVYDNSKDSSPKDLQSLYRQLGGRLTPDNDVPTDSIDISSVTSFKQATGD